MNSNTGLWLDTIPGLNNLLPADRGILAKAGRVSIPAKTIVFHPGDACTGFVLVLAGSVRVTQITEDGNELILYRINAGESCVLTTACLLAGEDHAVEARCETDVEAVALSTAHFQQLIAQSEAFRNFVFASFGSRLVRLAKLLGNLAFERLDVRLAKLLIERMAGAGELLTTHQDLASELGSAREVVSRRLEFFAKHDWLELNRGRIQLIDREALLTLAGAGERPES